MGLFLQKLEKSLRLSTRAHIVDLPLDTGAGGFCAVHPLRDQETYVAGGCGLSLEQQLLVDVLKQLYKIREEREKDEHQRRSRAAGPSHDRHVVEFLDEFVKVVAVCQAVLSQRAGEAPSATAAANRKRKLDSTSNDEEEMKWEQERKEQREEVEEEEDNEEEEDVQIRDLLAHLRKRAKVVVGDKVCCEHREKGGLQTRSERSLGCCGGPAAVEVGVPGRSQEGLCVVTLVQQVVTTMTAAANHGRNKRGWISSAALDNGWSGGVQEKRRRTVATTDGCSPPAGRKRKWAEDWGAASAVRARGTLRSTENTKGHNNDANNNDNDICNINTNTIAATNNCNNQEKRKKLGIAIVVTPAGCD